jgi:hypothetical protein
VPSRRHRVGRRPGGMTTRCTGPTGCGSTPRRVRTPRSRAVRPGGDIAPRVHGRPEQAAAPARPWRPALARRRPHKQARLPMDQSVGAQGVRGHAMVVGWPVPSAFVIARCGLAAAPPRYAIRAPSGDQTGNRSMSREWVTCSSDPRSRSSTHRFGSPLLMSTRTRANRRPSGESGFAADFGFRHHSRVRAVGRHRHEAHTPRIPARANANTDPDTPSMGVSHGNNCGGPWGAWGGPTSV